MKKVMLAVLVAMAISVPDAIAYYRYSICLAGAVAVAAGPWEAAAT